MSSEGKTILIADDEPDILELMVEEFEDSGFSVLSASCGNDGAKLVRENQIDVILSDFKMPNGTGLTILDEVNNLADKKPLFFFVSGQADIPEAECIKKGAKKFYTKPIELDEIISEIEALLS